MRRRRILTQQTLVPATFFALTLLLMVWSDQNPRVLLYAYVVGILTMAFMLGVLQLMGGGTGFLEGEVLRVELTWAAVLAGVFWTDDLVGRQLIIRPGAGVTRNLGYNTPPMNFLLAAIFLGAGVMLIVANVAVAVWDVWPFGGMWSDWAVLVILAALKYAYEIAAAWRAAGG